MKIDYGPGALEALKEAPQSVQKAFFKQVTLLADNLRHPSLRAKKYSEPEDKWQARINQSWRFYFKSSAIHTTFKTSCSTRNKLMGQALAVIESKAPSGGS